MSKRFTKSERLTNTRVISAVFESKKVIKGRQIDMRYVRLADKMCNMVLFAVPKSNIRKAVERNLIRRRMREVYRNNKFLIRENGVSESFGLVFLYKSRVVLDFLAISDDMFHLMNSL